MSGPLSITDLFTPLTAAQLRAKLVVELLVLQVPADKWRAGGVASTILTVCSILLAMMSAVIATIINGFFLPTATGVGLKALAFYLYGVTVSDATFATGVLTLTNTGGGIYPKVAGSYTALNEATGATYVNTEDFTIIGGQTLNINMRALQAGSAGNSAPGTILASVTPMLGVSVSNAAAFVGTDAPSDAAIRLLCTNKLAALSVRGVRTVYAYAIQTAINPVTLGPVNINRWAISESSHFGTVTLAVAAPSGAPDPDDVTGIATRVEAIARPSGVRADVLAATEVPYAPAITVWATPAPGTSQSQIKDSIDTAVSAYIADFAIGGVTAGDDTHGAFTGLFGEGVSGAIAKGCADIGAKMLSVRGADDLALVLPEVAADEVSIAVILVASTNGVLL